MFCNFLLADEINRAPAKVQSALLEVMQERQVTIGRESHAVPAPVPRDGDPEPDRVRGHLPAAGGAGRPVHDEGRRRLSRAPPRRPPSSSARSGRPPRSARSSTPTRSRSSRPRRPRSTSTRRSPPTPSRSSPRPATPSSSGQARPQGLHLVRRQPARLDQPRPRRPRPRAAARPPLRRPRPTSPSSPPTSCATASSRASRPSPRRSPPDMLLDRIIPAVPAPRLITEERTA